MSVTTEDAFELDPADFQAQPEAEETQETQENPETPENPVLGEDTTPPDTPDTMPDTTPEPPKTLKLKYNHEEREVPIEEAVLLAQKGMNYEKAIERAAQEARDKLIADMGLVWQGKPITTEAEYKQAMMEKEIMDKYGDIVPEEVLKEIAESRKFREEQKRLAAEKEEQAKRDQQISEFFDYFQAVNERPFDPDKDTIPNEVREAFEKGVPLKYAYMEYHNKELRNQLKIAKQNESNTKRAPVGSVTANGGVETEAKDAFLEGFDSV